MPLLLGLDLGTSTLKAVLFDSDESRLVASAAREYPLHQPAPDRAEQNPADWWQAAIDATHDALERAGRRDVAAIGLSGQMHGATLIDAQGQPLHPAIIWADQRSRDEVHDLMARTGPEQYAAITGTLPAAGFLGPTLVWLRKHQPELLRSAAHVLLPKDVLRLRLTGQVATDVTDAAGSGVFDIRRKTWPRDILASVDLPPEIFPPVLESYAIAGTLTADAAQALGLSAGIPVVAGCADQPAQAIGNGLIAPGRASVTIGSGGQVFTPVRGASLPTDPRLHVFNHAAPDTWYVLGAMLAAGLGLRWLRGITGLDGQPDAYPLFSVEAAQVAPGADGLIYLPYLYGERTPHMDPLARGAFIGLSYHHSRGHLARAVMEGVAFALRQALELSLSLGGQVETVIAAGGGADSAIWRQILADVFGVPLQQTLLAEQAGVGAAMLAGVGAGVYPDLETACARVARYGPVTEPDAARHALYNDLYAEYISLYPTLRDDFHRLARFRQS